MSRRRRSFSANESEITLSAPLKVAPSDELVAAIDRLFGEKVAELT